MSCVLAATSRQAADGTHGHVMVAQDLAAQPDSRQTSGCQHVPLGDRHLVWLRLYKFDSASGATSVSATGMQLIDPRILLESQHQSLALRNLKRPYTFHIKF